MNPKGSVTERLLQLEGDLQAVKQELRAANHRAARIGSPNNFRIARITNTPNANDDTFEVVFLDGKYTQSAGYNAPSYADRQLAARAVVHNIAGVKLAKDDVIPVWSWSNRFWTYVPETGTPTPGTDFAEYQANVFYGDKYYYDTGPNAGDEITSNDASWLHPLGSNINSQRIGFASQDGPDIGLTFNEPTVGFRFSETGYYRLTYTARIVPIFYVNGSRPSPAEDYTFELELSGLTTLTGLHLSFNYFEQSIPTDFHTLGTSSAPDFQDVDFGASRTMGFTTFLKIDYSSPATYQAIYIRVYPSLDTGQEDFGVRVSNQHMIVQKLFNNADA